MTEPSARPELRPRVVLLGASNLTLGISTVVGMALKCVTGPASFYVAMGHGRSYGMRSRVLVRSLPGILECGLWDALRDAPPGPTYALITDVGNDVAYGVPAPTILDWVEACLDRLAAHEARVAMSLPPAASLERMGPTRFRILKALLFPRHPLTRDGAMESVRQLTGWLRELGERRGLDPVAPPAEWYGLDPLHPTRSARTVSWQRMLAGWQNGTEPTRPQRSLARWTRLRTVTAERWWLAGRERCRAQPLGRLADGSTLAVY